MTLSHLILSSSLGILEPPPEKGAGRIPMGKQDKVVLLLLEDRCGRWLPVRVPESAIVPPKRKLMRLAEALRIPIKLRLQSLKTTGS
jgi:hypothetical protein